MPLVTAREAGVEVDHADARFRKQRTDPGEIGLGGKENHEELRATCLDLVPPAADQLPEHFQAMVEEVSSEKHLPYPSARQGALGPRISHDPVGEASDVRRETADRVERQIGQMQP